MNNWNNQQGYPPYNPNQPPQGGDYQDQPLYEQETEEGIETKEGRVIRRYKVSKDGNSNYYKQPQGYGYTGQQQYQQNQYSYPTQQQNQYNYTQPNTVNYNYQQGYYQNPQTNYNPYQQTYPYNYTYNNYVPTNNNNKYDIYNNNYYKNIGGDKTDKQGLDVSYFDVQPDNQPKIVKPDDLVPTLSTIFGLNDIPSINKNIKPAKVDWNKHGDKLFNNMKNIMNSIVPKKIKINDGKKDKNDIKIAVSNFFSIKKRFDRNEEQDDNTLQPDNQLQPTIQNWFNKSFAPSKRVNQLDDLQELLKLSKKYEEARRASRGGKYTDNMFRASMESIKGFGERRDYTDAQMAEFSWLRPEQFFKSRPKVFDTIDPDDILQGGLGDCYFLAAISSIASKSQRLERIILTKKYNNEGIYVVALCINGIWEDVLVDDLFPCRKYSKEPAFNSSKTNELWVMILEKAWAKVHGGYLNIAAGLTREALRDLTGASAKTFFTADGKERIWDIIHEAHNKEYVLTAGSDDLNYGSDAFIDKIGIAGSHAYSLLGAYEIVRKNGRLTVLPFNQRRNVDKHNKERVVKLRNPWGKGEWKGEWSDNSSRWTSELKRELGVERKEDGIFFMDFANFCKYYSDIQVCYYHDNYKYSAVNLQNKKGEIMFLRFELTGTGKYYFSVNQKNRRFFPKNQKYKYSGISQIIGMLGGDGQVKYVGSSMKQDKENWLQYEARPGTYYVYINTPWKSFVNEFSFSVYGPTKCKIEQISSEDLPTQFYEKLLLAHAKEDKSSRFSKLSQAEVYYKRWDDQSGLGYLYFENRDGSKIADVTVELVNCRNIRLCPPFSGFKPNIKIEPGKTKIISYEPTGYPSGCEMRIISSMRKTNQQANKITQEEGTRFVRYCYGKDVGVYVYILHTLDCVIYKYVNKSSKYYLKEDIEFGLKNCHIEGVFGSYVSLILYPGEQKTYTIAVDSCN